MTDKEIQERRRRGIIQARLGEIRRDIEDEREWLEFGASEDLHYEMAEIQLDALLEQQHKLENLLQ